MIEKSLFLPSKNGKIFLKKNDKQATYLYKTMKGGADMSSLDMKILQDVSVLPDVYKQTVLDLIASLKKRLNMRIV